MMDFFIWGWWYVASFLVVLGISYLLSVLLLRFTRRFFFKKSDLIVFSASILFIVTTLLSWAFAIDLFVKIPYRPIEFIGQPFWIPNIILAFILVVFASKQIKKWHSGLKTYTVPRLFTATLSWALFVAAFALLVYTRADYFSNKWDHRIVTYLASSLGKPEMCERINPYNGWRSICVLESLDVVSPESTDKCNYFAVQGSTDRVDCVVAKAIRNNTPELCDEFLNEDVYGPLKSYETFRCMSNFIGTEKWSETCKSIPISYPDKSHFLKYAGCLTPENMENIQGESSSDGMLSYKINQPSLNSGRIVSIQYESIPRCDSFTTSDKFSISFGDGLVGLADCKGVVEHEYSSKGTYQVNYIKNQNTISTLTVELE